MSSGSSVQHKTVQTWVRIRPTSNFAKGMIDLLPDGKTIKIHQQRSRKGGYVNNQISDWSFKVDGIFHNASQEIVYDGIVGGVVKDALKGINGAILCYGQTGAGKTFTMTGATENYKHRGVIPRAIQQLFKDIEENVENSINVRVSYLEVYNETMFDLLTTLPESVTQAQINPLVVVEDINGVYVKGLGCHLAQNEEEALNLLFEGETNRAIAAHTLNQHSSRSHCIFTLYIECRSRVTTEVKYTLSKLHFVDLAGSERLSKTHSEGKTQQEALYINKSLTFLEQAVVALADRSRDHVPFRQSKLTHCLKDSLGGNNNTVLVANVWGEAAQIEETVSTLRFATRMMKVKVEPAVNEVLDPMLKVHELEKELSMLKRELAMHDTLANRVQITYEQLSDQQRYDLKMQVKRYIEGQQEELEVLTVRQVQTLFEMFKTLSLELKSDIERGFRERYTVIDKTDPAAIQAAQEAGMPINDQGELVGEDDNSGFGIGSAQPSARAIQSSVIQARKKDNKKKSKEKAAADRQSPGIKTSSPSLSKPAAKEDAKADNTSKEDSRDAAQTPSSTGLAEGKQRPSTPPSKSEEFEKFKLNEGSEINQILHENKEILAQKKKQYRQTAQKVNDTKAEIDKTRELLAKLEEERTTVQIMYNDDGDIIIHEQEYLAIQRLKDLKNTYKTEFEELKALKAEVQYCNKLVSQCRQRLVHEFNTLYQEQYVSEVEPQGSQEAVNIKASPKTSLQSVATHQGPVEDEQEQFDRLQQNLLMEDPESVSYYNAKMRIQRRKTYNVAMRQAGITTEKKSPGTPVRRLKNQPSSMLHVI